MTRRLLTVIATAAALCATGAQSASATTLPASTVQSMSSVRIDRDRVYWFQRGYDANYFFESDNPYMFAPGSILSRRLGSPTVERIFKPQGNDSISAFNVAAGRVVVGLTSTRTGSSKIVELTEEPTGWNTTELATRFGKQNGQCGSYLWLANINAQGNVIVDEHEREGAEGKCDIVRLRSRLYAIARNGVRRDISTEVSGWAPSVSIDSLSRLRAGPGDWYITRESADEADDEELVATKIRDIESGKSFPFTQFDFSATRYEVATNGQVLMIDEYSRKTNTKLISDPTKPDVSIPLSRPGSRAWFHFCGGKIIEISRRKATRKRKAGSKWNLYLRDINGNVTQQLKTRLPRQTAFETCNEQQAMFHKRLRKGRARQFSVSLLQ